MSKDNENDCQDQPGANPCEGVGLPKADFPTFTLSLASSAAVHLGDAPDPETGKQAKNLALAKHTIDILAMLEEKTRNNLSEDEARLLSGLLFELRMAYVAKTK